MNVNNCISKNSDITNFTGTETIVNTNRLGNKNSEANDHVHARRSTISTEELFSTGVLVLSLNEMV